MNGAAPHMVRTRASHSMNAIPLGCGDCELDCSESSLSAPSCHPIAASGADEPTHEALVPRWFGTETHWPLRALRQDLSWSSGILVEFL